MASAELQLRASGSGAARRLRARQWTRRAAARRERLFEHFYRAHERNGHRDRGAGARAEHRARDGGVAGRPRVGGVPATGESVFAFALPSRREEDAAAAAGTRRPDGVER